MYFRLHLVFLAFLGLNVFAAPLPEGNDAHVSKRGATLNAFLGFLLDNLPVTSETITKSTAIITNLSKLLGTLTGAQDTYNEAGGACKEWTVVFARGTSEPGNVGILVGPPLFDALLDKFGESKLTIQGVNNYAASVQGYLAGGDAAGSTEMARQIEAVKTKCPNTKLIASGYSQGCQIVHNAVSKLQASTGKWISSALLFGDPKKGQALPNVPASKVYTACHAGDDICKNGIIIGPPHLTYATDVKAAADFAAKAA
ncbi:Cutinase [Penicillium brevicompactum]|uniref:Cutinase n=1 Tax=Penicillium brevicompactum TaxID=5074 RepID=A0A9W9UYN2_PENBR|nr:Cutinase [Penicillium brevicompactum]KAJ5333426.1 Cutinase [Penicillium brevicompactum]KAJ5362408.1 Cutinase [Penicillium brevicompactum]